MTGSENNPVVLIHGWAGSFAETWKKPGIDALLSDGGRRVTGIDLLGHGSADKPHDPGAYSALPQWLLGRLDEVADTVDAAGFSLGALTLLGALVNNPSRFGRVLLSGIGNGVFDPPDPRGHDRIVAALEGRAPEDDSFAETFARYGRQPGNDLAALTAVMKRPPMDPIDPRVLSEIDNEVLVVIGDKDFAAPADALASAFPNGSLVVLRNVDHFATPESFAFIDALLEFFGA